eukprot:548139-Amphidinium_carterae.1
MCKHCDVQHCQDIVNVKAVNVAIVVEELDAIGSVNVFCNLRVHDGDWTEPLPANVVPIVPPAQRHCCISRPPGKTCAALWSSTLY